MPLITMPLAINEPAIIQSYGVAEIYADGAVHRVREHVVECICYRAYIVTGAVELHEVARVIFPLNGFDQSVANAYQLRMGGQKH